MVLGFQLRRLANVVRTAILVTEGSYIVTEGSYIVRTAILVSLKMIMINAGGDSWRHTGL